MPLVKGRNGDDFRPYRQSRLQGRVVVSPVNAVPRVVVVPRANSRVHVPRTNAGNKEQIVAIAEVLDGFPVLVGRAKGESVGGEVGVDAVKAAS